MGYEAFFNRSFAHLPLWVLCTYNGDRLTDRILEGVWRTHPEVVADNTWTPSEHYEDLDQHLRRLTPEPVPIADLRSIGFGQDVEEFRERLARALVDEQVGEAKALDMLLAATEVAMNAIQHGGGVEDVRIGRAEGGFVCEIVDRGSGFDDPAAGYLAPRPGAGTGLWVARQLTWQIEFFRSSAGFHRATLALKAKAVSALSSPRVRARRPPADAVPVAKRDASTQRVQNGRISSGTAGHARPLLKQ